MNAAAARSFALRGLAFTWQARSETPALPGALVVAAAERHLQSRDQGARELIAAALADEACSPPEARAAAHGLWRGPAVEAADRPSRLRPHRNGRS